MHVIRWLSARTGRLSPVSTLPSGTSILRTAPCLHTCRWLLHLQHGMHKQMGMDECIIHACAVWLDMQGVQAQAARADCVEHSDFKHPHVAWTRTHGQGAGQSDHVTLSSLYAIMYKSQS